jgi:UDP-N-acetylmuramyl pentapeptide phosphotransferase/UDP-N-acetylglucosamine-1-phosphate transferase
MSETGSMALTLALATTAMMSDDLVGGVGLAVMPLVAMPLVATVGGNILQIASKKIRGKKLFRVAPIHHHFEAIGSRERKGRARTAVPTRRWDPAPPWRRAAPAECPRSCRSRDPCRR